MPCGNWNGTQNSNGKTPYDAFRERCVSLRNELHRLVSTEVARGRRVHVYGASTKGNTILNTAASITA